MKFCIYLKQGEPDVTFTSEEHIFPAGIGGIQKLSSEYVSHECNNAFSVLELSLMRDSLMSLPRQIHGPGKRGNLNPKNATKSKVCLMYDSEKPDSISLGYLSLGQPYKIPQLKISKSGVCHFITDYSFGDPSNSAKNFLKSLELFKEKYLLLEEERLKDEVIIGLHKNKWYVAVGDEKNKKNISSIVELLLKQQPITHPPEHRLFQTTVRHTIQLDDTTFRVCSKIIFNYLAFAKGQDFVLKSCFDPLRSWIVNGGENKYSTLIVKDEKLPIPFPEFSHVLIIVQNRRELNAIISFYGEQFGIKVKLSDSFEGFFEMDGFICDWKNRCEFKLKKYLHKIISY